MNAPWAAEKLAFCEWLAIKRGKWKRTTKCCNGITRFPRNVFVGKRGKPVTKAAPLFCAKVRVASIVLGSSRTSASIKRRYSPLAYLLNWWHPNTFPIQLFGSDFPFITWKFGKPFVSSKRSGKVSSLEWSSSNNTSNFGYVSRFKLCINPCTFFCSSRSGIKIEISGVCVIWTRLGSLGKKNVLTIVHKKKIARIPVK